MKKYKVVTKDDKEFIITADTFSFSNEPGVVQYLCTFNRVLPHFGFQYIDFINMGDILIAKINLDIIKEVRCINET